MVQDEPKESDVAHKLEFMTFIINKTEEKDAPYIMIDYENYWWGSDYVITTFC